MKLVQVPRIVSLNVFLCVHRVSVVFHGLLQPQRHDEHRNSWLWIAVLTLCLLGFNLCSAASSREFEVNPTVLKTPPAFLTQVLVPDANCAAVSPVAPVLVPENASP